MVTVLEIVRGSKFYPGCDELASLGTEKALKGSLFSGKGSRDTD